MPKALRDFLGMSFFFWPNESSGNTLEPIHIHVSKGKPSPNATKLWLLQSGNVELCHNGSQLSEIELARAIEYVKINYIMLSWLHGISILANKP